LQCQLAAGHPGLHSNEEIGPTFEELLIQVTPDPMDEMRKASDKEWAYGEPEALIYYVMDLETLVKWFALLFSHNEYDAEGNETVVVNDPIWTVYDERGNYLAAADKLQETWNRVMHDAT
jgi:hypothetical protein